MERIPFMKGLTPLLVVFTITAVSVAIIMRVPTLKRWVFGANGA
jgi:hypothetical protein